MRKVFLVATAVLLMAGSAALAGGKKDCPCGKCKDCAKCCANGQCIKQ